MRIRTLAEHAGIRAGVLFYDWVTALISCLVIGSVLISCPRWKQLSLSPRLVWSCGLSLLRFFCDTVGILGPLLWRDEGGWLCTVGVCQSSSKASSSVVCSKEVAEIWKTWNKSPFHHKFMRFCFPTLFHISHSVHESIKYHQISFADQPACIDSISTQKPEQMTYF